LMACGEAKQMAAQPLVMGVSGTCHRIFSDYIIHALFMKAA
jgi:hypothetical protein